MEHRPGSRRWAIANLEPGQSLYYRADNGGPRLMQQIGADISRVTACGSCSQRLFLAIHPQTREVLEIVEVTRNSTET